MSKPNAAVREEAILRAAIEQLAVVGYRALSIELVAATAGVNKTTVYRHWPTKKALVVAALTRSTEMLPAIPNTGSIRDDLVAVGREFIQRAGSAEGQGIFRVMALELASTELGSIANSLQAQHEKVVEQILERAVARGEVVKDVDTRLVLSTLVGSLHLKLFVHNERVDDLQVGRVVDLVLRGISPRAGRDPRSDGGAVRRLSSTPKP